MKRIVKPIMDHDGNVIGAEITETLSRTEFEACYEKAGHGFLHYRDPNRGTAPDIPPEVLATLSEQPKR